jgi:hypothetical protein
MGGVPLLDADFEGSAFTGFAAAPVEPRSRIAALWAAVVAQHLIDATDERPSCLRDQARAWLSTRSADLGFALDASGLDRLACSDRVERLAASGWRVSERWRERLRRGLERGPAAPAPQTLGCRAYAAEITPMEPVWFLPVSFSAKLSTASTLATARVLHCQSMFCSLRGCKAAQL